jgi:hypothetical protein
LGREKLSYVAVSEGNSSRTLAEVSDYLQMTADFYIRLLLAALIILAVWNLMGRDDLLEPVGDWLEKHMPYWGKPLGLCPNCMASVYGTATWFLTGGDFIWWIPFVLALSGAMVLVSRNFLK